MTSSDEESFLNDLPLSLEKAWELLAGGADDRHSPLHTPVVGSVTQNGDVSQRVMVLRDVDTKKHLLRFNTDVRASKVDDFDSNDSISVLGYHPAEKVQLRLSGYAWVEKAGPIAEKAWEEASLYGKRCYLADPAPGSKVDAPISGLTADIEGRRPSEDDVIPARENFSVLVANIERIEWLYLAHTGHRRATYEWNAESKDWDGHWLVP